MYILVVKFTYHLNTVTSFPQWSSLERTNVVTKSAYGLASKARCYSSAFIKNFDHPIQ